MSLDGSAYLRTLKLFDLPYREMPNWRTRGHGPLDIHAIGVHDTVTGAMTDDAAAKFCYDGRADLAGPLYNILIGHNGVVYLLSTTRSWNIGTTHKPRIDMAVHGEMPYTTELGSPPPDNYGNGNDVTLGFGFITRGAGPYTTVQYANGVEAAAALGYALGWTADDFARSLIGHSEATSRKVDPLFDMGSFRRAVKAGYTLPRLPAPSGITSVHLSGTAPVLKAGMRDPVPFKGGNYVARVQLLLHVPNTGVYDTATVSAVAAAILRLAIPTLDRSGRTVDGPVWERLYGIQG